MVELLMPIGLELDQDTEGNVFVKSIDKGGRAEKTGKVRLETMQKLFHTLDKIS